MGSQFLRGAKGHSDSSGGSELDQETEQLRRRKLWAYVIALPGIFLAVLIRWQWISVLGERGLYSTLFPALMIAAYLGGFWPGIVATIVGAIATNYFIVNQLAEVELKSVGDSVAMLLFLTTGLVISLLSESLHRARRRIIQDERRRAAVSLEQTHKRFSHLLENSSDIMTLFSTDGTILYQTPSVTRVLGHLPDDRIGKNVFRDPIVHPEDLEAKRAFFQQMIERPRTPVIAEFRLRHREGQWRNIEAIGQNLSDEPGIEGLIVNYRDVTERKIADQAIRDREERWRSLVQLLPQLIWTTDGCGQSEYFSPQVGRYTGLSDEKLLEGEWLKTVHPDDLPTVVDRWNSAIGNLSPYDLEHRIRRRDGGYGWFKVRAVPVRNNAGVVDQWIASCTDITEFKELESELRRLNQRLELAVRGSNTAIWEVDVRNDRLDFENGSYINVWEQLGFHSSESREGRSSPMDLVHSDDRARVEQALQSFVCRDHEEFESEHRSRHRSGTYRWMLIRGIMIRDEVRHVKRFTGTSIDVSNLKETEQALREAKDAAESANRSKDEFLANVSHEIRTPMNAILGMTELVLESSLTESQRRLLQTVKSAGDNLLGILNDLLDFSKIEAGKLHLDATSFSLRQSIGDVVRLLATRAHSQGLEFVCDVDDGVPDHIVGDAGRLRQVLLNLIGNAIKFTPAGEVVVNITSNEAPPAQGKVRIEFFIRDTGIGISASKLEAIFRPFEQEDTSTTRKYGGTGLGLAITTFLVHEMGGSVSVDSEPSRGSTFRFDACFDLSDEVATADDVSPAEIEGRRVLVVDDNETNRIILENWLKRWRLDPCCVADGTSALQNLTSAAESERPFELVVLDRRMPVVDGVEVVRQIRNTAAIAHLPVILLTSGDPEESEHESNPVHVQARLTKPCQQPDLLHAIQGAFCQSTPPPSEPPAPNAPTLEPVTALNILVAEDNQFNAMLLQQLLLRNGHAVTIVPDGRQALDTALRENFSILLLDIHMPELDGFQVARAIREHEQLSRDHLPILALTARSTPQIQDQCLAAGMEGMISKPMKADDLWAALKAHARIPANASASEANEVLPAETPVCFDDQPPSSHIPHRPGTFDVSTQPHGRPFNVNLIDSAMILSVCGGSQEMLSALVQSFLENCPQQMEQIKREMAAGNLLAVREAAHRLAGTLRAFSRIAGDEAISLEEAAEGGDQKASQVRVHTLAELLEQLKVQVTTLTVEALNAGS
ncbi:PAS domain S-box protein [Schlesneria sp. T3-172]|uniref:PAS domain S-box protein n=1 Tax=Schlesneria sphaerica TaxID=3373610 RepID=UPI0037C7CD27